MNEIIINNLSYTGDSINIDRQYFLIDNKIQFLLDGDETIVVSTGTVEINSVILTAGIPGHVYYRPRLKGDGDYWIGDDGQYKIKIMYAAPENRFPAKPNIQINGEMWVCNDQEDAAGGGLPENGKEVEFRLREDKGKVYRGGYSEYEVGDEHEGYVRCIFTWKDRSVDNHYVYAWRYYDASKVEVPKTTRLSVLIKVPNPDQMCSVGIDVLGVTEEQWAKLPKAQQDILVQQYADSCIEYVLDWKVEGE